MSKKIVIPLIILVLLVIAGGIFWWWQSREKVMEKIEQPEREREAMEINEYIKIPPPIQKEEIVIDPETGSEVVKDAISILFKKGISEEMIEKKIESINGEIIGYNKKANSYTVRIKGNPPLEETKRVLKQVQEDPDVEMAIIEFPASVFEQFKVPNDPKMGSWNESKPSGKNWGLETIYAPSAWDYNDSLEKVKIGIIDKGGFYTRHEDLEIPMININTPYGDFPESPYYTSGDKEEDNMEHGTHIAGIIGAISNNKVGITGTVWNKELFGFNLTNHFWGGTVIDGIEYLLNQGVKVINISLGYSPFKFKNETIKTYQEWYNRRLEEIVHRIEESEKHQDFLIIQAAGNDKVDAKEGVIFNPYLSEEFKEIGKRIITVGAIENDSGRYKFPAYFNPKESSNYGDLVDIVAPGKDVYTTFVKEPRKWDLLSFGKAELLHLSLGPCFDLLDDSYGCTQGTSMAAPFVTGVAGLVWGANSDLTAEQVKEIIVNSADRPIVYEGREYKILNAKSSVKIAYELVGEAIAGPQAPFPEEEIKREIPEIIEKSGPAALVPPPTKEEKPKEEKKEQKETQEIITPLPSGEIVFVSDRDGNNEIYVMNADGSNQINLTNSPSSDTQPAWSPDGKRIVFASDRDGDYEVYIMNSDGSNVIQLTNNSAEDSHPDWSPDGRYIVFYSNRDGDDEIYRMNADGSNQVNLTNYPGFDGYPRWSPDGKRIAFSSKRGDYPYYMFKLIYLMDPDGTEVIRLSDPDYAGDVREISDWSSDGKYLIYTTIGPLGDSSSEIFDIERKTSTYVGGYLEQTHGGSFSLDNNHLTFASSERHGNWEIYLLNLKMTEVKRLTENSGIDWLPAWSPR